MPFTDKHTTPEFANVVASRSQEDIVVLYHGVKLSIGAEMAAKHGLKKYDRINDYVFDDIRLDDMERM